MKKMEYLMPADLLHPQSPGTPKNARDALLQKLGNDVDLLALGSSVSRVVQMASADDEATRTLASGILSDVALTQKILRLANTVFYRTGSSTPVTTISRAIFLLGFDTVKTSALAMILVDNLSNNKHAQSVRIELAESLCASLVGRELSRRSQYQGAEEASIAALFKNLGRILLASHEHPMYKEINRLTDDGLTVAQASTQVLGCSYDSLAGSVLQEWNIPDSIINALKPLAPGVVPAHKSRQEWMRQVTAFSADAAQQIMRKENPTQSAAGKALLSRFGAALHLDAEKMEQIFEAVEQETDRLMESLKLVTQKYVMPEAPVEVDAQGLPDILQLATMDAGSVQAKLNHPSGKPINARDLLLAGVQDATQMMASGRCKVNELILLVLEILYGSLGFRFVTVCLKDLKTGQFRARIAIGEESAVRQASFIFPIASERDLFHLAMENNADLMIADASTPKIRELLPAWHRHLLPDAGSLIVLPLVLQKVQLGLIYADRVQKAPEGVPPDEVALIKALMSQVLSALGGR